MRNIIGKLERYFGLESSDIFPEGTFIFIGCQLITIAILLISAGLLVGWLIWR